MSKIFEKVNPSHPDKVADRIAGAMVDIAYNHQTNPKIAVEILIGHGLVTIIAETSYKFKNEEIQKLVKRICHESLKIKFLQVPQDPELAKNQAKEIRCGDNGIFKGSPVKKEQYYLTKLVKKLYEENPNDGKYIINDWTQKWKGS